MPKRSSNAKSVRRPTDINELAFQLVRESTEEKPPENRSVVPRAVSRIMAQMGSRGGKIGGKRRLATMTPEARSQAASEAAKARWAKKKHKSD